MLAGRINRLRAGDQGAAAVEFALVVPILVMMLFGIIDYGLYFANALAVRAGVSDAARQISVGNFSDQCDGPFAEGGTGGALLSKVTDCISPIAGDVYVKVMTTEDGWAAGSNVIVCAVIDVDGVTGLTPMPNGSSELTPEPLGGLVSARVAMPIQRDFPPPSPEPGNGHPTHEEWFEDWC